jgi:hypothetical protein
MNDKADIARLRAAGKVGRRLYAGNKSPTAEERSQILNEIAIDYCVQCAALAARHDAAISALERTLDRFKRILHRTTVRDVEETIAEAESVLAKERP